MNEIKIYDIKELSFITDFSFYIYILLWVLGLLVFFILIFLLFKKFFNREKNQRKIYYKILKEINLEDTKNSAYIITKYVRLLVSNDREKRLSKELIEALEPYKYKKSVEPFNKNIKITFERFMDSVDV